MDRDSSKRDTVAFGAVAVGAASTSAEAAAADILRDGMALLLGRIDGNGLPAPQLKGHLFEYIEAARFNERATLAGSDLQARVTAAEGRPHARADIEIVEGGKVVKEIQAKVSDNPNRIANQQAQPKYEGMDRLAPRDQADRVREISQRRALTSEVEGDPRAEIWRDSAERTKGELSKGEVRSGGTSNKELDFAAESPKTFATLEEARAVGREAVVAAAMAATAGAVFGGAISAIQNGLAYRRGETDARQAAKNVAVDAAGSGVRGAATGATGTVIRHAAYKAGLPTLAKSNVAAAVAASLIEAGVTVYDYAKGDISPEDAAERLGNNGCSTLAGIYTGAATGAIFGPVGAVVGSVAGYMLAGFVYQSCIAVQRDARLAEEAMERLTALCEEAGRVLDQQRKEFEERLRVHLNKRQANIDGYFAAINDALEGERTADAISALSGLVGLTGRELRLAKFEEFDEFMMNSDSTVVF